ncbi:hypothetical protein F4819DRAFT_256816 [Hypoxylon fuscum]|nr:hypothetical protein F4819DRAFT_256816 [Hypoxylon fuscum]
MRQEYLGVLLFVAWYNAMYIPPNNRSQAYQSSKSTIGISAMSMIFAFTRSSYGNFSHFNAIFLTLVFFTKTRYRRSPKKIDSFNAWIGTWLYLHLGSTLAQRTSRGTGGLGSLRNLLT